MKKIILFSLSGFIGFFLILTMVYFFYSKQLYEDKSVKTEMDLFSTQGGVLFYYEKYSVFPPTLELMFKTVGMEACARDSIFPDQYTGSQSESRTYTGKGGWVYSPNKKILRLNYKSWHPPYEKYILNIGIPKPENKDN